MKALYNKCMLILLLIFTVAYNGQLLAETTTADIVAANTNIIITDVCGTATAMTVGMNYGGNTTGTANAVSPTPSCYGTGQYDLWYSFTAPFSGNILIHNYDPSEMNALAMYSGTCGSLVEVGCTSSDVDNNDECTQLLVQGLTSGDTYYLQVVTDGENALSFDIIEPNGPVNDFCSGAIVAAVGAIGACPAGEVSGTTVNATHTRAVSCISEYQCDFYDVWYSITTPASGILKFIPGNGNPIASFYTGSCGSLSPVACVGSGNLLLTGSTAYLMQISTFDEDGGVGGEAFDFCLEEGNPPPANDTCAGAIGIAVNANGACGDVAGTTIDATTSMAFPCSFDGSEAYVDVWYSFTAPAGGAITFHSGAGDPYGSVFSGTCAGLSAVANGCVRGSGTVAGLTPGTIYYLQVSTSEEKTFDFCLEIPGSAPVNDTCAGAVATTLGVTISVNSTYATTFALPPCAPLAVLNAPDLWYTFIAPAGGEVAYAFSGGTIVLTLYSGSCGSLTEVTCAVPLSGSSPITGLTPGATYYAQLTSIGSASSGVVTISDPNAAAGPEINIKGNNQTIADGDSSPEIADDTSFGSIPIADSDTHTFTIENAGTSDLTISSISILNTTDFSVTQAVLGTIGMGATTTFTITCTPQTLSEKITTVTINSDDSDESVYTFDVKGSGSDCSAAVWDGDGGDNDWDTATNWNGNFVPTSCNDVSIGGVSTVSISGIAVAKSIIINEASLGITVSGSLTINGSTESGLQLNNASATFNNAGTLTIGNTAAPASHALIVSNGALINSGMMELAAATLDGILIFANGLTSSNSGTIKIGTVGNVRRGLWIRDEHTFNNLAAGVIDIDQTTDNALELEDASASFTNAGVLKIGTNAQVQTGIISTGAMTNSGTIVFKSILSAGIGVSTALTNNDGAMIEVLLEGELSLDATASLANNGIMKGEGGFITTDGTISHGATASIQPGASPGTLTITGDLDFGSSTYDAEINGPTAGTEHDVIAVSGVATLTSASLEVDWGMFTPSDGDEFTIMTFASKVGEFSSVTIPAVMGLSFAVEYEPAMSPTSVVITAASIVPVELVNLEAELQGKTVLVTWQTASESSNQGFDVERSVDGRNWQTLGFVPGFGNTQEPQFYSFIDRFPLTGMNYYRLLQKDFDGQSTYSKIVEAEYLPGHDGGPRLYPNPVANGYLNIAFDTPVEADTNIKIYASNGQLVQELMLNKESGNIDLTALKSGLYVLEISQDGTIWHRRVIVE